MKRVTITVKIVLDMEGKIKPGHLAERIEDDVKDSIGKKMWAIGDWHDFYVSKIETQRLK